MLGDLQHRSYLDIAQLILADWQPPTTAARAAVLALACVRDPDREVGGTLGATLVLEALGATADWTGGRSEAVRAELRRRLRPALN